MAEGWDFQTGLVAGRNEAAAVGEEWQHYAQGLTHQVQSLQSELQTEKVSRALNRADLAGMLGALATLDPETYQKVRAALERHYVPSFVARAQELGLPADYAAQSAMTHLRNIPTAGAPSRR